ncbi:nadph dehydrogenase [Ophiostoma piceae UAMH 11346]|uniref:Nadph dehydrogenase n=1 Tax=Ophiostoma piceae (strain UAMH 11346) TaxID=1262450 RepID=S3C410_OPHP1|nr:nadph dehydrogenase [Ophiostoma piceae UAMH 11346]
MESSRLFKPLKVGTVTVQHRIAMAPLTRFRATPEHVPTAALAEYYGQRASVPGTLIVTEATFISAALGGYSRVPGLWNDEQVTAWKTVTETVHKKGSFIFAQLWALGRAADPKVLAQIGAQLRSSSDVPLKGTETKPVPLTEEEIEATIAQYAIAAKNAIAAGFDGVEIHGANGYLIDQFTQDVSNKRTDKWGGSIENRSRFAVEVVKAVVAAVGAEHVGIRLSPYSTFQDMRMANPEPQFTDLLTKIDPFKLAYIHVVEARISGIADNDGSDNIDFVYKNVSRPLIIAGGFSAESAKKLVDEDYPEKDIIVAFGRYFISTPDLPYRLKKGIELNPYNRDTFYDWTSVEGYTGQPFSKEFLEEFPETIKSKA